MNKKVLNMFVLLLAVLLIAACATSEPAPPPDGDVTPPPTAGDTVWERIQAAGVMRVGTAADYEPYEYYVNTDVSPVIDGFDIALIKEVGAKLGVSVEIIDFAFEGLSAAVQLDQVDAVIAALSVTEERQTLFDFSNVYFSGVGVTLATEASDLEAINAPQDMAGKRVGVQKSSVYETWSQQELVSTGLIATDQLFTYVKPEHAVSDLTLGRLDIVLMDKQPALQYVNDGGVRIVGEGVNPQIFAIALPNGATELQARINQALTELQNEGVTSQLAMDYLGVLPDDTLPPVPPETPGPPPTPGGCYNGMAFVADLTIPDGTEMFPSTPFEKGWLIENVGTCTWDETYSLDYVYGKSQMGGKRTYLHEEVSPGEQYEIYVDMQTPSEPGEYAGFWQLFSGAEVPFGETLWVAIEVTTSSGATATPEACVIHSLTATPSELKVRGNLVVAWSWTCDSVAKSRLSRTDPDGTVVPLLGGGDVPNPGTYEDLAAKVGTMTYYLKVDSEFGASAEQSVSVIVTE